ncbi:cytochrome C peroxidase [unidentified eubacterium SCB49]|nr:cytochrome C peroxidase [unidentified eubacterium SCB49]
MKKHILLCISLALLTSCGSDESDPVAYVPTPAQIDTPLIFQQLLPAAVIPEDNPLTEEGIALGKRLFYDTRLSLDNSISCASCHKPQEGFSDNNAVSLGVDGTPGTRNSMPLANLAFNYFGNFNWDGSATTLEEQHEIPITSSIEMHNTFADITTMISADASYPLQFEQAFNVTTVTKTEVTKALAQFVRTMVSGNSKFDKYLLGEATLTPQEQNGLDVFLDETRGDCFHCHGSPTNPLWTDNIFHNNGLDTSFEDRGRGNITGDPNHFGQFKSPSLRNLAYTAPYMHDGRFATLEEVVNHYSEGLVYSDTIDPLMKSIAQGGVHLTENDKQDLIAFLLSLSDPTFINNPAFLPN